MLKSKREFLHYRLIDKQIIGRFIYSNREFENLHASQRCFILGNGPSLKKENLRLLEDEYVITVNQASRHKDFEYIKPNYHFWADPDFFVIDESKQEDQDFLNVMKSVNTSDNKPICFFPVEQREFIKKYKLDKELEIRYFYSHFQFYDGYKGKIDYSSLAPAFCTVVQWGISMAIYMGFSEIYLLGCDNTSLLVNLKTALQINDDNDYAYSCNENEKQRMNRMFQRQGLEHQIQSALRTFQEYRALHNYCKYRNIKLINCSAETLIDSIPRVDYSDVINENKL